MRDRTILEKVFDFINIITTEYILGTSIYLLTLFVLSISKSINWVNFTYWLVIFNFIFEKFLIKKKQSISGLDKERIATIVVRVLFIAINIIAFGINIITLN